MEAVFCVFDIGKSNKKFIVYDLSLHQKKAESARFPEIGGTNGLMYEDTESLLIWIKKCLLAASQEYQIQCVNFSCHGATYALLDEQGNLAYPVLSYTSIWPTEICQKFDEVFPHSLQDYLDTATPHLGTINIARSIHAFQLSFPDIWENVATVLFYPQYLAYRLCGNKAVECTYLGNHSYLWDFKKDDYSQICKQLGLLEKLPTPLRKPQELLGTMILENNQEIPLLMGVHDSNAAMVPYLQLGVQDFTLLSTGSWVLAMKPNVPYKLTENDFKESVYFNIDIYQKPLKTLGNQSGLIYSWFASFLNCQDESNQKHLESLFLNKELFVLLDFSGMLNIEKFFVVYQGHCFDSQSIPDFLDRYVEKKQDVYAALNCSLALVCYQQLLTFRAKPDEHVFIEGGFLNNTIWKTCLQLLAPKMQFYASNLKEAGCYGAALLSCAHLGVTIELDRIFECYPIEKYSCSVDHKNYFESLNQYWKGIKDGNHKISY